MKIGNIEVATPQHDALEKLDGENNVVAEFLEWIKTKYTLAVWGEEYDEETGDYDGDTLYPAYPRTEDVLAEYYDIDIDAFYAEKEAILIAYRKQQETINGLDN